jgi:outer membrane protein assembly factor BamB
VKFKTESHPKKLKNRTMKHIMTILTIAIIFSLIATSLVANAEVIKNTNPEEGTTSHAYDMYMTEENSVYASAVAKYGSDLIRPEYEWGDPFANTPQRTGFNPGPAPDRPDVLFNAYNASVPKVILGNQVLTSGLNSSYVASFSGAPMAMGGQLFIPGSVRVNISNSTTRNAVVSVDPHTGSVNWASLIGLGPTAGTNIGSSLGGSSYIFKVDDTHFCTVGLMAGGLAMWRTDGTFLWQDDSIRAGAFYHSLIVAPEPISMVFITYNPNKLGVYTNYLGGFTLVNPEEDRNTYTSTGAFLLGGRSVWNYTVDEAGNTPIQSYGDGRVYMSSYSSTKVYAINATNGEKIWETDMPSFNGYMSCYAEGKIFVGCLSYTLTALNATNGTVIWENTDGEANRGFYSWCINYAYGRVYCHDLGFGRTGAMKCVDAETGKTLWASTALNSIGYYTTVVADGKVFGNQADGSTSTGRIPDPVNFACWDAFTGNVLWSIRINLASPVVAYGCLYFVLSGQLYALSTAVKSPEDWTMWRGSVEHPGWTLDRGPTDFSTGPKWTFTAGSGVISSPVVVKGKLYINSNDGYTYCLDAYNGTMIWRHASNEPLMTSMGSTPAVYADRVIVGPDDGNLYILDANTGKELNKVNMGPYRSVQILLGQHNIRSSPIIFNGEIYVASIHNDRLYAINAINGQVDWWLETGRTAGSVGIGGGYLYLVTMTSRLYKITPAGSIVWNVSCVTSNAYTPVVAGNYVYLGVASKNMTAYRATDGKLIINAQQPNIGSENSHGSVTYLPDWALTAVNSSGYQFGASNSANANATAKIIGQGGPTLTCMRADNGSNIWSNWGSWEIWGSPVVAGIGNSAVVYICSEAGSIQVINASNSIPISWYTTGSNIAGSVAIWDGKLYIGSCDNKVYCFEDHQNQVTDISATVDKDTLNLQNSENMTVTVKLTAVPNLNPYEEIGRAAPVPPLPNAPVIVTLTNPDGVDVDIPATTDLYGTATLIYTPDTAGTWKVRAKYLGEDKATISYGTANSDYLYINVTSPATPTPSATPTPAPTTTQTLTPTQSPDVIATQSPNSGVFGLPATYTYAVVAAIVIAIAIIVATVLLLRRKK